MSLFRRKLLTTSLIGIVGTLALLLAACSEDAELIGTDMNEQEASAFTLTDHRGDTVELSDFQGKAVAMTFIFTNCPDVCPLIINRMNAAYEQVPDDKKDDIAMVAVTVDPNRDDPETMAEYLQTRGVTDEQNWYGLTGDIETLEPVWKDYFVTPGEQYPADPEVVEAMEAGEHDPEEFIEEGLEAPSPEAGATEGEDEASSDHDHDGGVEEDEDTAYWLAHTDVIYTIDAEGIVRVLMRSDDTPEDLAHNLEILVNEIPD